MKIFCLVFIITTTLFSQSGRAQNVTLEQAYNAALARKDYDSQNQSLVGQADAVYKVSRSYIFPQVIATGQYQRYKFVNTDTDVANTNDGILGMVSLTQAIFHGGLISALDREKASKDISNLTVHQNDLNLYSQVAISFYHIQILEGSLDILKETKEASDKIVGVLKKWVSIGRSKQTELLTDELQNNDITGQIRQANADLEVERANFANITRMPKETAIQKIVEIPKLQALEFYLGRMKDASLNLQIQQKNLFIAEKNESIARSQHLPTVALNLNAQRGDIVNGSRPGTNTRGNEYVGMVNVSLPIFEGGLISAQTDQAAMKKLEEKSKLNLLQLDLETQVKGQYAQLQKSIDLYKIYSESIQIAQKNYKVSEKDFRLGIITNIDLLTSLNSYLSAKQNLDNAYFQMKTSEINLSILIGERKL